MRFSSLCKEELEEVSPMNVLFTNIKQKQLRRKLRKDSTRAEILLWNKVRGRAINNYKFKRQYSIGGFVVDFYCPEVQLVIEVDGDSHFLTEESFRKDEAREKFIKNFNIKLIRFTNTDVLENIDSVLGKIADNLTSPSLSLNPPPLEATEGRGKERNLPCIIPKSRNRCFKSRIF